MEGQGVRADDPPPLVGVLPGRRGDLGAGDRRDGGDARGDS